MQVLDQADDVANTFHTLIWVLSGVLEPTEYSQHHCVRSQKGSGDDRGGSESSILSRTESFNKRSCGQRSSWVREAMARLFLTERPAHPCCDLAGYKG